MTIISPSAPVQHEQDTIHLHQVLKQEALARAEFEREAARLERALKASETFSGLLHTYEPLEEGGLTEHPKQKIVQQTTSGLFTEVKEALGIILNIEATKETGNLHAHADLLIEGNVVATQVPATLLLYLVKRFTMLHEFVALAPELDPTRAWVYNEELGHFVSEPTFRDKTEKTMKAEVIVPPTDHFPAQVKEYSKDRKIGQWTERTYSGAMRRKDKLELLSRIKTVMTACQMALEQANRVPVQRQRLAEPLLKFIFG